jgi:hypothetical protein
MDNSVLVAVITSSGAILVAAITFYLTKKHQFEIEWRHEKLNHYKVLLSALSDLAVDGTDKEEANKRFALAANTIALCAPQSVITALMNFHDEVKFSNKNKRTESHDRLLKELLIAIRKDIKLSSRDNAATFNFHLVGSAPKS